MKNLIQAGLIGLAIGSLIELLVSFLQAIGDTPEYVWATPAYLEAFGGNTLAAATLAKASYILLGILFQLASRIYASEKISLTLATFSHFLLALAGVATTGLVLRWFPLTPAGFAVFGLIFFLVYSLIWGISWLRTSRSVQELQEKLAQQA